MKNRQQPSTSGDSGENVRRACGKASAKRNKAPRITMNGSARKQGMQGCGPTAPSAIFHVQTDIDGQARRCQAKKVGQCQHLLASAPPSCLTELNHRGTGRTGRLLERRGGTGSSTRGQSGPSGPTRSETCDSTPTCNRPRFQGFSIASSLPLKLNVGCRPSSTQSRNQR